MNAQTSPEKARSTPVVAEPNPRKTRRILLMAALPAALLGGAGVWWVTGGRYETTDNAICIRRWSAWLRNFRAA